LPATTRAGVGALDVRDGNESRQQPAVTVRDREIPLVVLHRCDRHLGRELEVASCELPGQCDRPFDECGHLVE
jgi:hypothetical protein